MNMEHIIVKVKLADWQVEKLKNGGCTVIEQRDIIEQSQPSKAKKEESA